MSPTTACSGQRLEPVPSSAGHEARVHQSTHVQTEIILTACLQTMEGNRSTQGKFLQRVESMQTLHTASKGKIRTPDPAGLSLKCHPLIPPPKDTIWQESGGGVGGNASGSFLFL